jgi:hypothetical protein
MMISLTLFKLFALSYLRRLSLEKGGEPSIVLGQIGVRTDASRVQNPEATDFRLCSGKERRELYKPVLRTLMCSVASRRRFFLIRNTEEYFSSPLNALLHIFQCTQI